MIMSKLIVTIDRIELKSRLSGEPIDLERCLTCIHLYDGCAAFIGIPGADEHEKSCENWTSDITS